MKAKLISVDSVRNWPRLLGRECNLKDYQIGKPALLDFNDGLLRTSKLKKVVKTGNEIHLFTANGLYKLEEI
ncbi:MAG: hypothetical protein ACLTXM_07520 [Enterococcus sp.]